MRLRGKTRTSAFDRIPTSGESGTARPRLEHGPERSGQTAPEPAAGLRHGLPYAPETSDQSEHGNL